MELDDFLRLYPSRHLLRMEDHSICTAQPEAVTGAALELAAAVSAARAAGLHLPLMELPTLDTLLERCDSEDRHASIARVAWIFGDDIRRAIDAGLLPWRDLRNENVVELLRRAAGRIRPDQPLAGPVQPPLSE